MSSEYDKFARECQEEVTAQGNDDNFLSLTKEWYTSASLAKYSYHFEWLGRPVIQYPQDLVALQEIIWRVKPDLIIETGIAHGGSMIFYASMLGLLDCCSATQSGEDMEREEPPRLVLGVDIDIRSHNQLAIEQHPMSRYIKMMQGSSIEPDIVKKVHEVASNYRSILVCLDSNHTHEHVLAELEAYAPLVTEASYCIVFDTVIDDLPKKAIGERAWGPKNNPKTAVTDFLAANAGFEIDEHIQNKLMITAAPQGYLRRVST